MNPTRIEEGVTDRRMYLDVCKLCYYKDSQLVKLSTLRGTNHGPCHRCGEQEDRLFVRNNAVWAGKERK